MGLLSARGMSTRAIAPVAGVTRQGVSKALKKVATELPPEPPAWRVHRSADAELKMQGPWKPSHQGASMAYRVWIGACEDQGVIEPGGDHLG